MSQIGEIVCLFGDRPVATGENMKKGEKNEKNVKDKSKKQERQKKMASKVSY